MSSYIKKQIDMLTQLLENHNISLPGGTSKKEGGSSFEDQERVHALVARTVIYPSFIIDFGASMHMVSPKNSFSYIDDSKGPNIWLGDNSENKNRGKGNTDFDHGSFNNVLYAPGISANLLSVS